MHKGILYFKNEALEIQKHFPELAYSESSEGSPYISGKLLLRDATGVCVDSYSIRIEPTVGYPFAFPHVYETGSRIPANIDWHVFPDGHFCIKSIPEETLLCKQGITLLWFIKQELEPYFFNQKYREIHGYFLNERPHGVYGNIQYFEEVFRSKDLALIARALLFIKRRNEPDRVSSCFCGSGIKYRKCHRDAFRLLSKFSDEELELYARIILSRYRP